MDTTSASTNASKIVVGVALAAVFGTGIYIYGVRSAHDTQVPPAIAAVQPPPPAATAPPAPPPVGAADQVASEEGEVAPAAATANVAQNEASTTPAESAAPAAQQTAPAPATHHVAKRMSNSGANSNSDTASNTPAQPAAPAPAVTPPVASTTAPATGSADVAPAPAAAPEQAPAASAQDGAAPNPTATADNGTSDSKISTDVKSEIASAAPNSNVDVTTTNGAVALTGSVPSQDAVAQAKQAAMTVQGVKTVDTSRLLVASNQ